jgi:hypothetical protein
MTQSLTTSASARVDGSAFPNAEEPVHEPDATRLKRPIGPRYDAFAHYLAPQPRLRCRATPTADLASPRKIGLIGPESFRRC